MRRALAGAVLALSGCVAPGPAPVGSANILAPAANATPAEDVIAYMGGLRTLNDSALAAEARRQRTGVRGEGEREGDLARVKAALALSLVESSEEAEILALVDPVAKSDTADGSLRSLAGFLHGIAVDRRRLKKSAAAAQDRATQLQQKLDALTALEKSLSQREPAR